MNVMVFLIAGVAVGYCLRKRRRLSLDGPISLALVLMIFLLGVKTGEVRISGAWLLGTSVLFAVITTAGSLLMAVVVRRLL
ncbi:MAG: LysO family transporter [Thermococci archaeon]|nr:LysO family transporter [Thermococci archaeon]